MFKAKCKCIDCEHLEDGIYFQRNECYNRIRLEIKQAMTTAKEEKDYQIYDWLKDLEKRLEIYKKYYSKSNGQQRRSVNHPLPSCVKT